VTIRTAPAVALMKHKSVLAALWLLSQNIGIPVHCSLRHNGKFALLRLVSNVADQELGTCCSKTVGMLYLQLSGHFLNTNGDAVFCVQDPFRVLGGSTMGFYFLIPDHGIELWCGVLIRIGRRWACFTDTPFIRARARRGGGT
jgi:hypothetical protein